ncbi:putative protein CC1G_03129 Coprinopsis cinerea okayama7 130 [Lyophyllum shimeji]|uniref:Uncharacterized protein n=1 Tax=Lyophyllum shimeji TaxID=47721 RepID=A0A9P3PDA2_LYOSH|nr:putative protein CC1G_03129 Coprinopsis cinerea okayama7 130 [Lyophyllum shimeji]
MKSERSCPCHPSTQTQPPETKQVPSMATSSGVPQVPGDVAPDESSNRLMRFGDWAPVQDPAGEGPPLSIIFYHGRGVAQQLHRLDGWSEEAHPRDYCGSSAKEDAENLDLVLSRSKEWLDRRESSAAEFEDYSVIMLYASSFGYRRVFKLVDTILCTNAGTQEWQETLKSAVFLIELLNVELFNYVSVTEHANNFRGTVFRALAASDQQLQSFQKLAASPVTERYWAILLRSCPPARTRIQQWPMQLKKSLGNRGKQIFLWRIHVVELEPELLEVYRQRFPTSVVSTICAVPIRDLSRVPEEDEIVLRGPFFQLIRMQEEVLEGVGHIHTMDSVMLNTNRDHLAQWNF